MAGQKEKTPNARLSLRNLGNRTRQANSGRQVLPATPAARRYAAEKGVDLQELSEIGKDRRITERDIDIYLEKKKIFEKRTQNGRRQEVQETLDQPEEPKLETADDGDGAPDESAAAKAAPGREPGMEAEAPDDSRLTPEAAEPETAGETPKEAPSAPRAQSAPEQPAPASNKESDGEPKKPGSGFDLGDFNPDEVSVVSVSPLARELAEEHHIDLTKLTPGSGPNGRIVRYDVRQWLKAHPDADESAHQPAVHQPSAPKDTAPRAEAKPPQTEPNEMRPKPESAPEAEAAPKAAQPLGYQDPVAAKIYRAIRENMGGTAPKQEAPKRARAEVVAASAMAEGGAAQTEVKADAPRREDPEDAVAIGPYSLNIVVDVTKVHDACRNQSENGGVELTDYVAAAASRLMSLYPKACGGGEKIALMTISERKGLICTPGFAAGDQALPADIAAKRRQMVRDIEEDRTGVSADGAGLHIMSLGQGVGVNYICDKQKAPILAIGVMRKEMQISGMHYITLLTLSQKRGASNVAASVAFLNALKTFLENPDALFQLKPKEEK